MPVTRECEKCGQPYTRPASQAGRFCSARCAYDARIKPEVGVRRNLYRPNHPLATGGYVGEPRALLYDHIGPGPHRCHWCKQEVCWAPGSSTKGNALVVDHLDSNWRNNALSNLVPSCQKCNGNRETSVGDNECFITRTNGTRMRIGQDRICKVCGATFVTEAFLRTLCRTCQRAKNASLAVKQRQLKKTNAEIASLRRR
jgi:hypothetical protein